MADAAPKPDLLDPRFLAKLEQLELVSRKILKGQMKGDLRSRRKGQSIEFADYRNYVVGDDLRFLDWNLLARLDKLFLRVFMEEEDLHLHILVDNSLSMDFGTPDKLHYAIQIAAALGFVGLINLNRVIVETFNHRIHQTSPALRGKRNFPRLVEFLNGVQPSGSSDLKESLRTFSIRTRGQGIVVVLSDFMDKNGYDQALRYLAAKGMDVYCIQILSPEETHPEISGDLKLVDIEDEDTTEVTASSSMLKRYRENLEAFQNSFNHYCLKRGISLLTATTDQPFEKLILTYLRQRGILR